MSDLVLGLPGYTYPDLYDSGRLKDLADAFDREVQQQDPGLFAAFEAYRLSQGSDLKPEAVSEILVGMARTTRRPHAALHTARSVATSR